MDMVSPRGGRPPAIPLPGAAYTSYSTTRSLTARGVDSSDRVAVPPSPVIGNAFQIVVVQKLTVTT